MIAAVVLTAARLATAAVGGCPDGREPATKLFVNKTDGEPFCIEDFDAETKGRFCSTLSPNQHTRVLPVSGGNIDTKKGDVYLQCAHECMKKGMFGTAGIENGLQCWCSNMTGPQGVPGPQVDCNASRGGLCPGHVYCGGRCRITQFAIICHSPPAAPMSGGTIFLICFAVVGVTYLVAGAVVNHRRGEIGLDHIPNREFWVATWKLIGEGCIFSALTCAGGTKTAFKVGHSTYTRYEQL